MVEIICVVAVVLALVGLCVVLASGRVKGRVYEVFYHCFLYPYV